MDGTNPSVPFYRAFTVAMADKPATRRKPKPKTPRKPRLTTKVIPMPERGPMSRRLPPPPPVPPPDPIVKLTLTIQHRINGQPFGPGLVEVPQSIAGMLAENEQRNIAEERGLSQKRATLILGGGRTVPVPPETFDGDYTNLPPSFTQGG